MDFRGLSLLQNDLVIENYPLLEKIIFWETSLSYLNSLKICNCEKLRVIEMKPNALFNVKNVIIDSTFKLIIII